MPVCTCWQGMMRTGTNNCDMQPFWDTFISECPQILCWA